jgi:dTDP-4-dehydrorhamnose reductase
MPLANWSNPRRAPCTIQVTLLPGLTRILITGAAGMLGLDVQSAAAAAGHEVSALARAELDLADAEGLRRAFVELRPDAVINCAAYTKVDAAETEIDAAVLGNALGPAQLASAAAAAGAWLVHVSTDYVFDGTKTSGPYLESDPPLPRSVYGWTKLAGEAQVRQLAPRSHTIVRSSWLYGIGGPCFPATILKLASERDELRVVEDQRGCPTFTGHLARALVELAESRAITGLAHVAAAGECSWFEFAREIVAQGGVRAAVQPCRTDEFPRPAPRPAYSVLRSERGAPELPHWREGLSEYLSARVTA